MSNDLLWPELEHDTHTHDLESEHNFWRNVSKILDLAAIVGLALKGKIHWEACVNKGAPNAMPLNDHLISLEMVARNKCPRTILINVGNEVIDQHPTVLLQQHAVWLLRCLTRPPDDIPYVVGAVARHARRAKVVGGEVLLGGAVAIPELVVFATKIDSGNQHTHTNPVEQLLAGHLLLLLCSQP